jgi:photosystem II stability/assembly factor-like uncharacterized protein
MRIFLLIIFLTLEGTGFTLYGQWDEVFKSNDLHFNSISLLDEQHACAGGSRSGGGFIVSTQDGGNSWNETETDYEIQSVDMFSNSWVVAVGEFGGISISTNAGKDWAHAFAGTNSALLKVSCPREGFAYIAGCCIPGPSIFLRTTDFGVSWSQNGNSGGSAMSFLDSGNGLIANSWNLLNTFNGGQTWTSIFPFPQGSYISELQMIDTKIGIAVSQSIDKKRNKVFWQALTTSDGGSNWRQIYVDSSARISAAYMRSDSSFFLATGPNLNPSTGHNYFRVLKTANGGRTWQTQINSIVGDYINDIQCVGDVCFAVGSNKGIILKTPNLGGPPFENLNSRPLIEIFPIPATTFITIDVGNSTEKPEGRFVLYNGLGQVISKHKGRLPISISVTGIPSGNYFISTNITGIDPETFPILILQ